MVRLSWKVHVLSGNFSMEKMNGILTSRTQLLCSNQQDQKEVSLSPDWEENISEERSHVCQRGALFSHLHGQRWLKGEREGCCNAMRQGRGMRQSTTICNNPYSHTPAQGWRGANRERERGYCNVMRQGHGMRSSTTVCNNPYSHTPGGRGANMCWTHLC